MGFAANNLQSMISSRADLQPTAEVSSGLGPSRLPANSGALSAFEVLFTQQLAAHLPQQSSTSVVPSKAASTSDVPTATSSNLPTELHKSAANDDNTAVYSLLNPLLLSQIPSSLPKFDFSLANLFSGTNSQLVAAENAGVESGDVVEGTPLAFGSSKPEFSTGNQGTIRSTAQAVDEQVAGQGASSSASNLAPSPSLFDQTLTQMTSVAAEVTIPQAQLVSMTNGSRSVNAPAIDAQSEKSPSAASAENRTNIDVSQFDSVSLRVRAQDLPLPVQKPLKNFSEPNFVNANPVRLEQTTHDIASSKSPSIADELAAEIERQLRETDESESTTIQINLDHPKLGRVKVTLSLRCKSVAIRIAVQNSEAQQLVNSQLNGLQQSLASSGIDCNQFVVACDDSLTNEDRPTERQPVAVRRWNDNQTSSATTDERNDRLSFVA